MSYNRPGVTMLDQLPDLEELEAGMGPPQVQAQFPPHGAGLPPGTERTYQKFIRGQHRIDPGAGMMNMEYYDTPGGYGAPMEHSNQYGTLEMGVPSQPQPPPEPMPPQPPPAPFINCIDIAKHVQDCPICSRFYRNDTTVYIIAIVVLAIVCLLLLKKVLDV
uniref:Uncharacterized protein n=1 Tax=viral metagenome TaxID=1070528 RepID=A0A6C0EL58_9ZZZZ